MLLLSYNLNHMKEASISVLQLEIQSLITHLSLWQNLKVL